MFLTLIRSGDVVLDVGANEGYFTLLFSDLVGRSGAVHAFEPIGPTFARLHARMEEEAWFTNACLVRAACCDTVGGGTMLLPGTDSAQAALVRHRAGSWASSPALSTHDVRLLRLDDYLDVTACPRVDFVKLDVEGAELQTLRGMQSALTTHRPLLCLEVYAEWTCGFAYTPLDLTRCLRAAGYDRLFVLRDHVRPVTEQEGAALAGGEPINLLCGASAVHGERLARLAPLCGDYK